MDKLNIDVDTNLDEVKTQIVNVTKDKPKLTKFFKKLLSQIDKFINEFKAAPKINTTPESSVDENSDKEQKGEKK